MLLARNNMFVLFIYEIFRGIYGEWVGGVGREGGGGGRKRGRGERGVFYLIHSLKMNQHERTVI